MDRKREEMTLDVLVGVGWIGVVAAWIVIVSLCSTWVGDEGATPSPMRGT